jgi:hypothetical protein
VSPLCACSRGSPAPALTYKQNALERPEAGLTVVVGIKGDTTAPAAGGLSPYDTLRQRLEADLGSVQVGWVARDTPRAFVHEACVAEDFAQTAQHEPTLCPSRLDLSLTVQRS